MGGAIRIIIIKDNIIHKQTRWTNPMPYFVEHYKFIERNNEWWNEYINQESQYKHPDDDFSPDGYGLVVLDSDNKRVFDCQNYSFLRTIDKTGILLEMSAQQKNEYYPDVVKKMIEKSMLKEFSFGTKNISEITNSFEDIMKLYNKQKIPFSVSSVPDFFYIDWEKFGWEFKKFEESEEGYANYFEVVKKYYQLTNSEKNSWATWIKKQKDE